MHGFGLALKPDILPVMAAGLVVKRPTRTGRTFAGHAPTRADRATFYQCDDKQRLFVALECQADRRAGHLPDIVNMLI